MVYEPSKPHEFGITRSTILCSRKNYEFTELLNLQQHHETLGEESISGNSTKMDLKNN